MVESHAMKSWITYDATHPFPLENIPFGVYASSSGARHCCTRIGEFVIDLAVLESHGLFNGEHFKSLNRTDIFSQSTLNTFMELGRDFWHEARVTI